MIIFALLLLGIFFITNGILDKGRSTNIHPSIFPKVNKQKLLELKALYVQSANFSIIFGIISFLVISAKAISPYVFALCFLIWFALLFYQGIPYIKIMKILKLYSITMKVFRQRIRVKSKG